MWAPRKGKNMINCAIKIIQNPTTQKEAHIHTSLSPRGGKYLVFLVKNTKVLDIVDAHEMEDAVWKANDFVNK